MTRGAAQPAECHPPYLIGFATDQSLSPIGVGPGRDALWLHFRLRLRRLLPPTLRQSRLWTLPDRSQSLVRISERLWFSSKSARPLYRVFF